MRKSAESGFIHIVAIIILLAGLVGGMYLVQHPQIFQPKASNEGTRIEFVNDQGAAITSTTSQNVKVKLIYVVPTVQGVSTTRLLAQASTPDDPTLPWSDAEITDWIQRNQANINQPTPPGITRQYPDLLASLGTRAGIVAAFQLYVRDTGGNIPPSLDELSRWATAGYATTTGPGTLPTTLTLSPSGEITSLPDGFIRIAWTDAPSGAQLALRRENGGGWQTAPISVATSSTTAQLAMGDTLGVEIRNASGATLASGSVHLSAPATFPTHFKIANSQEELASSRDEVFDQNGKIKEWTLTPGPGGKTVYAQFKVNGTWEQSVSASIGLVFSESSTASSSAKLFLKADKTEVGVNQEVKVNLYALTSDAANLFNAKINFPKDLLEVTSIETSTLSEIKSIEEVYDNNTGTISIVGGVPNPGIKTTGEGILMATIIMKTKASGSAKITFDASSQILKNSDNSNILSQRDGITISIDQNFISRIISGIGSNTSQSGSSGTNQGAISSGTVAAGSGDGNGDKKVDLIDLSILMSDFNQTSGIRLGIDMNKDGVINSFDSSTLTNRLIQDGVIKGN
ncbi:MAG: hypothetical protein A3F47_01625 [Candidatus Staskawiczbacteria bacterium RIFCSPHIGHO2_12_FULL_38_11]|uniref:Dockerin domain-containing protein n=1 Tax=Candidatus Staskawiczbacteria bacterium RIFCSPHIGHO2_12_FULL_38_11 TaxID=1802209 RepID=A0A1G2I4T1_9BACT|nr:MAG: hypothetical protein A3F47_01625 [Candidatus Staskawiczbacteria bacterium RIFCSPHIGHO2_12_FULL_38_11]